MGIHRMRTGILCKTDPKVELPLVFRFHSECAVLFPDLVWYEVHDPNV